MQPKIFPNGFPVDCGIIYQLSLRRSGQCALHFAGRFFDCDRGMHTDLPQLEVMCVY